jgi:hypothetical protein
MKIQQPDGNGRSTSMQGSLDSSSYQAPISGAHDIGGNPGEVRFDITYPERLSRGLIFIKWLLVIPHLVVLYLLGMATSVVLFIAWFAILFTGKYPRGLWDFSLMVRHWTANVSAYYLLMRDEYPPFGAESYPVRLDIEYPERLSRGLIFIKWLLIIPHLFALVVLAIVAAFVWVISWFVILFTGSYPRGMFDFMTGFLRWVERVNMYAMLMTDTYLPFSME